MRKAYDKYGVVGYYTLYGSVYENKHESAIKKIMKFIKEKFPVELCNSENIHVLDLACGNGIIFNELINNNIALSENIDACDPYTFKAFEKNCIKSAFKWSFEDIINGILDNLSYDLVICSFALHLLDVSKLFICCYQLALKSNYLLILTPHKKPEIKVNMGWEIIFEIVKERIHIKLYKSMLV